MACSEEIIIKIFNDNNIDKNERYMLLMFIANSLGSKEPIIMPIKSIMDYFQCKGKEKIIGVLKSLESKGYIEIIKECGKVNKYRLIKYNSYEQSGSEIVTGANTYKETSSKNMTGYTEPYTKTSTENMTSTSTSSITGIDEGEGENFKESIENTGVSGEVISLDHKRNCYSSNLDNNIYINNNKLYINIFNAWNEININTEKIMSYEIKKAIYNSLEVYGEERIIQAIQNYKEVYYSHHYYNYRWTLSNFLKKVNGVKRFMKNGDIWLDYKSKTKFKNNDSMYDDFDIQRYID